EAAAGSAGAQKYGNGRGLREAEAGARSGRGSLALSRRAWARAASLYQQCLTLAEQMKRTASLPYLYSGLARALAGLGRTEEALEASRESVRFIEEFRAELRDSSLRSGFLENRQGIYYYAGRLALHAQPPDQSISFAAA